MIHLTESSIDVWAKLQENNNTMVYSSLREFHHPIVTKGFAIKYVLEGCETYTLEGRKHCLFDGEYLLSNATQKGTVQIQSTTPVVGFCVNIDTCLIHEVIASILRPDTAFPDPTLAAFFDGPMFLDQHYSDKNTALGHRIKLIAEAITQNKLIVEDQNREIFYFLAESLVEDQYQVFKQLQKIPAIKYNTRKELMRRLLKAKEYMDQYFQQPIMIENVAKEAYLSEYHFYRLFKNVFGITPNQYLIKNRILHAKSMLKKGNYSITEIATFAGFTDIYSFSKVFKKIEGVSPTKFTKNKD